MTSDNFFDDSFLHDNDIVPTTSNGAVDQQTNSINSDSELWPTQEFTIPITRAEFQSHQLLYSDAAELFGDMISHIQGDKNFSVPEARQGDALVFFMKQAAMAMNQGVEQNGELLKQLQEKGFDASKLNSIAHQKQSFDTKVFGNENRLHSEKALSDGNTVLLEFRFREAVKDIGHTYGLTDVSQTLDKGSENPVSKMFGKLGSLFRK